MPGTKIVRRVAFGIVAASIALAPVGAAAAQDGEGDSESDDAEVVEVAPADAALIESTIAFYVAELADADFDGDGVPDIEDSDGDGIPDIPEGEPGDRDIAPGDGQFLQAITSDLQAQGLTTIVDNDDGSDLLGDCGGMAMSFDGDGQLIDMAIGVPSNEGGGPSGQLIDVMGEGFGTRAFTKTNPFVVDTRVIYIGTLPKEGDGALEHNWSIKTQGISLDKGGDPNENLKNRNIGEVSLDEIPAFLRPAGIFPMKGQLDSENGRSCTADGWIQFEGGNPLISAPSAVAAALGATGVVGLLFNSRPAMTWKD